MHAVMAFLLRRALPRVVFPQCPGGNLAVRALSVSLAYQMKRPTFDLEPLPKRPPNAYMLFLMDNNKEVPKMEDGKLNLKAIGEKWRLLSISEAKVYKDQAAKEAVKYKQRYKTFLHSLGGPAKQDAYLEKLKQYRIDKREYLKTFRLKKKDLVKPRKRSGYNLFVSEYIKEAKTKSLPETQEVMKTVGKKWHALTDKGKSVYNLEAARQHEEELRSYERRKKKAIKSGIPASALETKVVRKKKATATTTKKATTRKTGVDKALANLMKNADFKSILQQTLKAQDLGDKGKALAAALEAEEKSAEQKAADLEAEASIAEEEEAVLEDLENLSIEEETSEQVEGDIFGDDSDSEDPEVVENPDVVQTA